MQFCENFLKTQRLNVKKIVENSIFKSRKFEVKHLLLKRNDAPLFVALIDKAMKEDMRRAVKKPNILLTDVFVFMRMSGVDLEEANGRLKFTHTIGLLPEGYVGFENETEYEFFRETMMPFKEWIVHTLRQIHAEAIGLVPTSLSEV